MGLAKRGQHFVLVGARYSGPLAKTMLAQLGKHHPGARLIAQRRPDAFAPTVFEARRVRRAEVALAHVPVVEHAALRLTIADDRDIGVTGIARQTVERLLDGSRWPFETLKEDALARDQEAGDVDQTIVVDGFGDDLRPDIAQIARGACAALE